MGLACQELGSCDISYCHGLTMTRAAHLAAVRDDDLGKVVGIITLEAPLLSWMSAVVL